MEFRYDTYCGLYIDPWLAEQNTRWNCPGCGTRFSWYDKACGQCGRTLYNAEEEEKGINKK